MMWCDAKRTVVGRKLFRFVQDGLETRASGSQSGLSFNHTCASLLLVAMSHPLTFNDFNRAQWRIWHPYRMERPSDGLTCGEGVEVLVGPPRGQNPSCAH